MKLVILLLFLFSQLLAYGQRSGRRANLPQLFYAEQIFLSARCFGDSLKVRLEIRTDSEKDIKLFGFFMTQKNYKLTANGHQLTKADTLTIDKNHPVEIRVRFIIDKVEMKETFVKFSSDQSNYQSHEMKFEFGADYITVKQIRSGEEVVINFPDKCADSIKVYFPYGGTQSGASLYADSISQKSIKTVSYGIGEDGNYLWFSKKDIGRYYVRFGACHWGNQFWMNIKQKENKPPDCIPNSTTAKY